MSVNRKIGLELRNGRDFGRARTLADRRARRAVEQRAVRHGNASKVAAATTLPADIRAGQSPSKTREEKEGPRTGSGPNPAHAERVEGGVR
jgi:hypothetical protein